MRTRQLTAPLDRTATSCSHFYPSSLHLSETALHPTIVYRCSQSPCGETTHGAVLNQRGVLLETRSQLFRGAWGPPPPAPPRKGREGGGTPCPRVGYVARPGLSAGGASRAPTYVALTAAARCGPLMAAARAVRCHMSRYTDEGCTSRYTASGANARCREQRHSPRIGERCCETHPPHSPCVSARILEGSTAKRTVSRRRPPNESPQPAHILFCIRSLYPVLAPVIVRDPVLLLLDISDLRPSPLLCTAACSSGSAA